VRTQNHKPLLFQPGRPSRSDQKCDISAGLSKAATEVSTGRSGTDDEHPHESLLKAILSTASPPRERGSSEAFEFDVGAPNSINRSSKIFNL
jgi:hypothetical protein